MPMRIEGKVYIDLNGPDGNAFAIAGLADNWAKQMDMDFPSILADAESYTDVLNNFDALFKHRIDYQFINDPRAHEEEEE